MSRSVGGLLFAICVLVVGAASMTGAAEAAGTRMINLTLYARDDVGPGVVVQLLNSSNVDVADECTRGALISPEYDDWVCNLADGDYQLAVHAPSGVVVDLYCRAADGTLITVLGTGSVALPAAYGFTGCSIATTPPATYPPVAEVSLSINAPDSQAGLVPTLFDADGVDVGASCAGTDTGTLCTGLPYGEYRIGLRNPPAGTQFAVSCWVTRSSLMGTGNQAGTTLTLDPALQAMQCTVQAARPVIQLAAFGAIGPNASFAVAGADGSIACTPTRGELFECGPLEPGQYQLDIEGAVPDGGTASLRCHPPLGVPYVPVDGLDQIITITGTGVEWYFCEYTASGPSLPTTTQGGPSTTRAGSPGLPTTGRNDVMLPVALLLVGLGTGVSRLARRPVR